MLLLGKNRTTGAENPVPIDLRRAVSREKEKRAPGLLQSKNKPAGQRTFFPLRGKIGPSGINDEAPKGRGKGGPVLLLEAKNRPAGR